MKTRQIACLGAAALGLLVMQGCDDGEGEPTAVAATVSCGKGRVGTVAFPVTAHAPTPPFSVAAMDKSRPDSLFGGPATTTTVAAKFLILSANGSEPELAAIRSALEHRGVPYDVFVASTEPPLTATRLASGTRGNYQATVLTDGSLWIPSGSALSAAEWQVLADYEARFRVRRVSLNTWPDPAYGFSSTGWASTDVTPLSVGCTTAGAQLFRDVNCTARHDIKYAWSWLAQPNAGAPLTPLLTDAAGNALAALHTGTDGRESLLLMFANDQYLVHSLTFLHGIIGWASKGTYLGERRIDLSAQVDDLFLSSDMYTGGDYRMTGADADAVRAWQVQRRANPQTPNFRLAMAFNADGIFVEGEDDLMNELRDQSNDWHWISHTHTHAYLDDVDYATAHGEFENNRQAALSLGLQGFDVRNIVTPGVSGLVNPAAMQAATTIGIRFAVTDSSRPGCDNPSPNKAFYNAISPSLLLLPRRPTNLFYNVSTPAEWLAEYNALYRSYWGHDVTYAELLDKESDVLVVYLLRGEVDPWMFHQANLRAYDGTHTLLGDLIDATLTKLATKVTVPVRTPAMHEVGTRVADRMKTDAAGVRGTIYPGRALMLTSAVSTTVRITGMRPGAGEAYGGDRLGAVTVNPWSATCVALDAAGQGCNPRPTWAQPAGPAGTVLRATCDAGSNDP